MSTTDSKQLYYNSMKALAYVKNVPGKPLSDFADNFILVFDLTSIQEATEIFVHPELTNSSSSVELKISTALKKKYRKKFFWEKSLLRGTMTLQRMYLKIFHL